MLVAISHDLRTPLTRMRMRAERIGDDALREAIRRDIDALEAIVVKTLDFARVESRSGRCERIDLSSLIATIVDERIDALQDVRVAAGARVVLAANGAAVRRIVENLIDNALEYAGSAEVELTATGGEALIAVADRGPGIPEAELESVFRPFHCLEGSRSRETGGTGLGLAIARTLARAHGGDVTLANRTGGGLVATVALPRDPHLPGPDCRGGRGIAAGQAEMSTLADSSNAPR
jgi:signal transduction histidine kinase